MTMVKTLVALATERMLLKTSGPTFLRGIEFMYAAGLAPDRLSVMMTSSHKYVLQFHSKCDIRPFAANYPNFGRVLRGIVHVREWRIKSIEFVNVAFYMRDVDNLERAIEKLGVELVLLRNCTYPGVQRGDEAVKFLSALNRKKQAVVCEYGDDRLKHRIGRRASGHRTRRASRNGQEVIAPPQDPAEVVAAGAAPVAVPQADAGAAGDGPAPRVQAPAQAQPVRRPIPLNPEQARQLMPQMLHQMHPPAQVAAAVAEAGAQAQALPGRASSGRVVVGAHVYEFRAVDVPNPENLPAVQNLNHLLNVLSDNANDVRVIVLPQDNRNPGAPIIPANLNNNNNNNMVFRSFNQGGQQAPMPGALPGGAGGVRTGRMDQLRNQAAVREPQNAMPPGLGHPPVQPGWNASSVRVANVPPMAPRALVVPVPMFGVAVNEPQVQRGGDDSNDSTDREEMYDPEQQRNEALRDLVADPEAQPNFAPVEAQAVDLEMLEEEGEADDDEVMEGVVVEGQYMIEEQPIQ